MKTTKTLFNNGWTFAKTPLDVQDWKDLQFFPVELPHDWLIYNTDNLYESGIGWYQTQFSYKPSDAGCVSIRFDGVYMDSTLFCNGSFVGEWKYGYSSFEHELTPFLREGTNTLVLKVLYQAPNSRWYSGAGIYRNVWLIKRGASYIPTYGVYISTKNAGNHWNVEIETELFIKDRITIIQTLYSGNIKVVELQEQLHPQSNDPMHSIKQVLRVEQPCLWSPQQPHLYILETKLLDHEGHCIDQVINPVGFRTLLFDPDKGLIVNGNPTKLQGTCEHHDLGALGAAFNREAQRYRMQLLKQMGVNAIRTSHNMPDPQLMDLADELGFLIVSEAFDMWERPKTEYDYARFFPQWFSKDIESWVRRDRNHPSLLMWSIGNEIYDTHISQRGEELTQLLMNTVRQYDPKSNAPVTLASNYMPWENAQKCADILKYAGYNYGEKYYDLHHRMHPDWIIYGSETSSVVQSRGIYHFPYKRTILTEADQQCSALGNSPTSWGARSPEECINNDRITPHSLGMFIWSGFDYLGEPTPYHTKNSYFGQIDSAGFPKDSFYLYQAAWTDYKKSPMIHLFPYWDWNPGQMIDIRIYSNAPRVALYCNNRLIGTKNLMDEQGTLHTAWWTIPYEMGELTALAYDEQGRCIARSIRRSFGDPVRLNLRASKTFLEADGRDLVFIEISTLDAFGNTVENAANRVHITMQGPGRLRGLDNGDSTDNDSYKGTSKRLFNGKLMALVGSTKETGLISVTVTSPMLPDETITITAVPTEKTDVDCYAVIDRNSPCIIRTGKEDEIPLRKIELHLCNGSQHLTPESGFAELEAYLYPIQASYQDLQWSVVNEGGIPSPLATVTVQGNRALVNPRGDGNFVIRCSSTNGTDHVRLISQLEFTAAGFGTLYKDPYQFCSAGLYDDANDGVGPGNEQGIATARDITTIVGYRDLDFGTDGSDTISLPIFTLSNEAYGLEIWQGYPEGEGSIKLGNFIYKKKSIWNVYQEATYHLNRRLRLLQSIYFVTTAKMHIKGFIFEKQNRAHTRIYANEYDELYGDQYILTDWGIKAIGNNVTIAFRNLHFDTKTFNTLRIYGRSLTEKNSIQIRFSGAGIEQVHLIDFEHSEQPIEKDFTLPLLSKNLQSQRLQVSFIFLPGSSFDFGWFQFQ
ncbi:MAG TPA: glycoside hydrolase family 2 TIM barrel-domain containing protein [Treponema sp.]|jgi:beta-galactosidase|nr:glycoside hydrolase family 2 TIM barrel-domain containing protein [Treponema sp.]HPC71766.1 glycoside hydrolase family 2 TIM barrel-domain containing protein [Treponema sp.]HRS04264.1 glycoside hydrolase family 2 TIM barrel-domain containing protein [Treponema sp.]HRU28887.1 glycoside hydrolase family 2 TIM barrel-domain containing protein [Treponema sp.]